jgi:Domain of unknown function (DUF4331)
MSHHFDSPTAIGDGRLNLCDLYVFPESPGTSTLVVTVNPDAGRSSPVTFRPDALYELVIASDGGTREDRAFRISFGEPDADGNQDALQVPDVAFGGAGVAVWARISLFLGVIAELHRLNGQAVLLLK